MKFGACNHVLPAGFGPWLLATFLLVIGAGTAVSAGDPFSTPRLTTIEVNWQEALSELAPHPSTSQYPGQPLTLDSLNKAAAKHFPTIADSPLPVLLPLDMDALVRDHRAGDLKEAKAYSAGFAPTKFFLAGASGYDAAFSFNTADVAGFADIKFSHPILVTISGFAFLYDVSPPTGRVENPVTHELGSEFPGLRRQILESTLRYSFERYGVPYVVSIQCFDARHTPRRLSCRNADRIAQQFLRALHLSGGTRTEINTTVSAPAAERPQQLSSVFTYHPAGSLIPGSGMRGHNGKADTNVYAHIRFPLADAPAYANSQSFMNWGDCDQTGRRPQPRGKDASYRCRVNSKPLVFNEGAPDNYSYPWRDNFCEHRHFYVGQCPSGQGHQGQDIRPSTCRHRNDGADRCEAYLDDTVAVRDGMILRESWQESFLLYTNTASERLRFRYLHMHPGRMNQSGLLSGRRVREGDVVGEVGNFNRRDNWTTYHLHFELHVPTRDGWVRVNPYMTLVAAYEHLIQARGVEITEPDSEPENLSGHVEATSSKASQSRKTTRKPARKNRKKHR